MQVGSSSMLEEKRPLMKELLARLLEIYPYASLLAADCRGKSYTVSKRGVNIAEDATYTECGYVIKVYDGDSYGEYAFNELDAACLDDVVKKVSESLMPWRAAIEGGFAVKRYPAIPEEALSFEKSTEYRLHPQELGDEAIIARLSAVREKALSQNEALIDCQARMVYQIIHKLFLSPKKELTQNVMWSSAMMSAIAPRGEEVKDAFVSCGELCGAEILSQLEEQIPQLLENIGFVLKSEPMIPGEYDCVCMPDVTGLIVHEAFGHGVEMDMFVKKRALAQEYIGQYVASPLVTMHDGAAAATQAATYFFDDEGTPAQDTVIIEKGILKRGICDAQAGMALGVSPTGNGRRQSTDHKAYTRMTNTFFEGGTDTLADMIASIDYGFLLGNASGGMEDPKNWGIQCMVNYAREIRGGEFTGRVFSPVVMTGYVPDLLKSISMMSAKAELSGSGMCGKGHKEWVKVSDGGPCIKARIRLG